MKQQQQQTEFKKEIQESSSNLKKKIQQFYTCILQFKRILIALQI